MSNEKLLTSQSGDHDLVSRVKDFLASKYYWDEKLGGFRTKTISAEVSASAKPDKLINPSFVVAAAQTEVLVDVIEFLTVMIQGEEARNFQKRIFK